MTMPAYHITNRHAPVCRSALECTVILLYVLVGAALLASLGMGILDCLSDPVSGMPNMAAGLSVTVP